jgi:hypothetical protein
MNRLTRTDRLVRVRQAEHKAASAERDAVEAARQHRAALLARLDALHDSYVAAAGPVTAATFRGISVQRQRLGAARQDTLEKLARIEVQLKAATDACRAADQARRGAEKLAERARRDEAIDRARRETAAASPRRR